MPTSKSFLLLSLFLLSLGCGNKPQANNNAAGNKSGNNASKAPPVEEKESGPTKDATMAGKVKTQAQEWGKATMSNNYKRLAEMTYDGVVEGMGGKEQALAKVKESLNNYVLQGIVFISFTVGEPGDFYKRGNLTYVVVPTTVPMQTSERKVTAHGFLLGVSSDNGTTWKFINDTTWNSSDYKRSLPRLPSSMKLPEAQTY